jgi:hypothetical protein
LGIAFVFSGLTPFGLGLMGLSAVLTDLLAFCLLVLRQVLIVMSVILFPIAMTLWILPGTQRYWKLWSDNFIKLLMLFPLIMAMIYTGRVFAHIFIQATVQPGSSKIDRVIASLVLFIAFFGPYWFLPKAFKWGGQIYAAAANGVMNATQGARDFPRKYALDKAKVNREERGFERAERLANNRGRFLDPLFAGRANFALARRARRNRYQDTLERGRKTADEQAQRAVIGGAYERLNHEDKVRADILVAQGRVDDTYGTGLDGREAAQQRAALERLAKYGDWDAVSLVREAGFLGEEGERVWQGFVAAHIGEIHQNVPHLSPQRTDLARIAYGEFRGAKDFEFDELVRQAMTYQTRDPRTGRLVHVPAGQEAAKRAAHIRQATEALHDIQFMASISEHGRQALELIAALPQYSPEVQVVRGRGGQVLDITLPTPSQLLNPNQQPQAVGSIRAHLLDNDPNVRGMAQGRVAATLSDLNLDPQVRSVYENLLRQLKTDAAGDATSVAGAAYNDTINQLNQQLVQQPVAAEQASAAAGNDAATIAADKQRVGNAVAQQLAQMRATGLDLIP